MNAQEKITQMLFAQEFLRIIAVEWWNRYLSKKVGLDSFIVAQTSADGIAITIPQKKNGKVMLVLLFFNEIPTLISKDPYMYQYTGNSIMVEAVGGNPYGISLDEAIAQVEECAQFVMKENAHFTLVSKHS